MSTPKSVAQLLVEGKNDQHVVWALCKKYDVLERFTVETPPDGGGIEKLLDSLPVRLKIAGLRSLGVMLDADFDINSQWNRVRHRLNQAGYDAIPQSPEVSGTIIRPDDRPTVGVWIMPDNKLPGMLEDFVAHLIPKQNSLAEKVDIALNDIEANGLNNYSLIHRPKAYIHTWLAWQETPGQPMGQAITANVLSGDGNLVKSFVDWLNELFG